MAKKRAAKRSSKRGERAQSRSRQAKPVQMLAIQDGYDGRQVMKGEVFDYVPADPKAEKPSWMVPATKENIEKYGVYVPEFHPKIDDEGRVRQTSTPGGEPFLPGVDQTEVKKKKRTSGAAKKQAGKVTSEPPPGEESAAGAMPKS